MKKIFIYSFVIILLAGCQEDILFDTIEAPPPQVSDLNWNASVSGNSLSFAEGGRVFRLPNPLDPDTQFNEIDFSVLINSNDNRNVDSIALELQYIPSIPSNTPLGWDFYQGFKIPEAEQSSEYQFDFTLDLAAWGDHYTCTFFFGAPEGCGFNWVTAGVLAPFGIPVAREDNVLRLGVYFDDGSFVRLAQVQFSYPLRSSGIE